MNRDSIKERKNMLNPKALQGKPLPQIWSFLLLIGMPEISLKHTYKGKALRKNYFRQLTLLEVDLILELFFG